MMKIKNLLRNRKGFTMSLVVAYIYIVLALSVFIITLSTVSVQYSASIKEFSTDNLMLDKIGYDFAFDGKIIPQKYNDFLFNLTEDAGAKTKKMQVAKEYNGKQYCVLTVVINESCDIQTWYYGNI